MTVCTRPLGHFKLHSGTSARGTLARGTLGCVPLRILVFLAWEIARQQEAHTSWRVRRYAVCVSWAPWGPLTYRPEIAELQLCALLTSVLLGRPPATGSILLPLQ